MRRSTARQSTSLAGNILVTSLICFRYWEFWSLGDLEDFFIIFSKTPNLPVAKAIILPTADYDFRVARGGGDLVNCVLLGEGIATAGRRNGCFVGRRRPRTTLKRTEDAGYRENSPSEEESRVLRGAGGVFPVRLQGDRHPRRGGKAQVRFLPVRREDQMEGRRSRGIPAESEG